MRSEKKLVFVITSMARGGAERVVSILSNYYAQLGWNVSIVMLWHNIVRYNINSKVKIVDLSNDKKNPKLYLPIVTYKLVKYFINNKPNIAVSFIAENCIPTDFACRIAGVRHITSERIDPSKANRSSLLQKIINWVYSRCDCVVLQTERAKKFFCEKIQNNCVVIGNPIEVKVYAKEKKKKKIVAVGRLEKQKNHAMLIHCFSEISYMYPDFILQIYGEGSLRSKLQKQIQDLGLAEKVFLMGNVSDLHEQISDAYMFVLSSDFEGLSNALLEAMMMGIPCISTNCAGSDEVIVDGENGILVPVGDENALSNSMIKMIDNQDFAKKISQKATTSAFRFKTENIITSWRSVIEAKDI